MKFPNIPLSREYSTDEGYLRTHKSLDPTNNAYKTRSEGDMAMAGLERQPMRILFFEFSILPLGGGLIGFLLTTTAKRWMLTVF
jgi:hypothetical protein